MLLSILASFGGLIAEDNNSTIELEDEPIQFEATSPGHPVFAEYMGAHWCGPVSYTHLTLPTNREV